MVRSIAMATSFDFLRCAHTLIAFRIVRRRKLAGGEEQDRQWAYRVEKIGIADGSKNP